MPSAINPASQRRPMPQIKSLARRPGRCRRTHILVDVARTKQRARTKMPTSFIPPPMTLAGSSDRLPSAEEDGNSASSRPRLHELSEKSPNGLKSTGLLWANRSAPIVRAGKIDSRMRAATSSRPIWMATRARGSICMRMDASARRCNPGWTALTWPARLNE